MLSAPWMRTMIVAPAPARGGAWGLAPDRAEHLLQDRAAGADRVLADLLFLVADHQVQAVQRLARDVLVDARVLLPEQADAGGLARDAVVLRRQPDLGRGLLHRGQELGGQRRARAFGEEV